MGFDSAGMVPLAPGRLADHFAGVDVSVTLIGDRICHRRQALVGTLTIVTRTMVCFFRNF